MSEAAAHDGTILRVCRGVDPNESNTPSKLPLSAFIICMNEEEYLANCIESLGQCAEIIIVDSGSTDGTVALVQRYINAGWPIRFMHEDWRGYAAQKQFALEQCAQPWCFSIDADERFDDSLRAVLPELLGAPESIVGWRISRRPYLIGFGYTPEHVRERYNLRLIRKGHGAFDLARRVHEGIMPDGEVGISKRGSLLHFRPLPIDEQILKENKYSTLKADQYLEQGQFRSLLKMFFNPPSYFLRLYLRHGLWRCGIPGFIQAMTGAAYSFLYESKIYQRRVLKCQPPVDNMDRADAA
ncbi:MAG: glycosyltransferase family 2 protein [Pirellulales bacterium]|nr:glycosyltransferase family 2 protein [Pirellulales bacterium]